MNTFKQRTLVIIILGILILITTAVNAQNFQLVWADEFNDTEIDPMKWKYETGPTNDNVHYYTNRTANVYLDQGTLKISALKESYQGWNYTSGLIKTERIASWRYGRIEARIKLPKSPGFVPAFWLQPEDNSYGFWPYSGEIDIMEHPTNEVEKIYGTIHSAAYSSFTGTSPQGSTINVADAESEFHIYAIEWDKDKIDFFVDDQNYFTFTNGNSGSDTWPFDKPFYIILNLAVGGGWVGTPNSSTVFPAIMEVDYVRVYQEMNDILISGEDYLPRYSKSTNYSLPQIEGANYLWNVTGDAEIIAGQNTNSIIIDWNTFSGKVEAEIAIGNVTHNYEHQVIVSNNLLKNYGFEKGVSPWYQTRPYPGDVNFTLISENPHTGNNCLKVDVKSQTPNAWDVQLSQRNLLLETGKQYSASFWAKAKISGTKLIGAVINSTTFSPFYLKEFTLTDIWAKYELNFTPSSTAVGQFNIDMGGHLGTYYFDDFTLSLPELNNDLNQIANADFSNGKDGWIFNSYSPAQATGEVVNGEFAISIINGGLNLWDIHLGQTKVVCEKGKKYTVSFDAYSDAPRDISALVGKNSDPWTVYSGSQIISLTKEKKTYSYSFIMTNTTDSLARIGFDLGKSSVSLYIDNISLNKGEIPTKVENENPILDKTLQLYQNYPNPFNPTTKIKYSISSTVMLNSFQHQNNSVTPKQVISDNAYVRLTVDDILGREVVVLVNENQKPGDYEIEWNASNNPSGVYFFKLQAGKFVETKKMILLR